MYDRKLISKLLVKKLKKPIDKILLFCGIYIIFVTLIGKYALAVIAYYPCQEIRRKNIFSMLLLTKLLIKPEDIILIQLVKLDSEKLFYIAIIRKDTALSVLSMKHDIQALYKSSYAIGILMTLI